MKCTMKLIFRSLCVVFVGTLVAIGVARFLESISTEVDESAKPNDNTIHIPMTDSMDDLFWFVQISDLHVSIFQDKERITELREFCDLTLKAIKPPVVLASGDLTDAKLKDHMGSQQKVEEWKIYSDVLNESGILKKTTWLDIRGNHDNFDVPGIHSPRNYFKKYSAQGHLHEKSYMHTQKFGKNVYSFIGVDACPDQGLKRPFNFVGYLPFDELDHLKLLDRSAAEQSNYTVWFGHYPTSCILNSPYLRNIIGARRGSMAYLSGHFHTLLSMVPRMYTIQKEHYLELELADWKDNRFYRLAAIDHGHFSFIDVKHREWPVILVTNPKHALYQLRLKEPRSVQSSTHVRILVFSTSEVTSVKIKFDNDEWKSCDRHVKNKNFFLKEWDPLLYTSGIHYIHVMAADELGRERTISQPFSLDGSTTKFDVMAKIILMLSFPSLLQILFGTSLMCCVFPLCVIKIMGKWKFESQYLLTRFSRGFFQKWVRRYWLLSSSRLLFYLLVTYPLYMAVGPWAIGEVIEGHTGVIFIWGTYVNHQFVPELSTYGFGFIQLAFFHFPLIAITAYSLDQRRVSLESHRSVISSWVNKLLCTVPFFTLFLCHLWMAFTFWAFYGMGSVAMGPVRVWPIVTTFVAWYYSNNYPHQNMRVHAAEWKQIEGRT